jgi:hypothetical protein
MLAMQGPAHMPIALPVVEAERLIWRLLATLSTHAVSGETLTLRLARNRDPPRSTCHCLLLWLGWTMPRCSIPGRAATAWDHGRACSAPALR